MQTCRILRQHFARPNEKTCRAVKTSRRRKVPTLTVLDESAPQNSDSDGEPRYKNATFRKAGRVSAVPIHASTREGKKEDGDAKGPPRFVGGGRHDHGNPPRISSKAPGAGCWFRRADISDDILPTPRLARASTAQSLISSRDWGTPSRDFKPSPEQENGHKED